MGPPSAIVQISTESIDSFVVVSGLFGGLALFLLGMDRLTRALRIIAGDRLRTILGRLTANRFSATATGAGLTAVVQSSSVVTVMVVGLITAGLLTLEQSVGVIMGANIGTTVTAQIVAFDVSRYALALVAVGFAVYFFGKSDVRKAQGGIVLGLGMVFFGMAVMGEAMDPLSDYEPFRRWLGTMSSPLAGVLAGAVFTAIVQSSSATTGVVLALAFEGLIDIDAGIALILGANIGTSVTAQLAAIGKPRDALRAAWVHTLFNTLGVIIWLPFIPWLADLVEAVGGPRGPPSSQCPHRLQLGQHGALHRLHKTDGRVGRAIGDGQRTGTFGASPLSRRLSAQHANPRSRSGEARAVAAGRTSQRNAAFCCPGGDRRYPVRSRLHRSHG